MSNECMQNKSAEQMTLAFGFVKGHKKLISAPHLGTRKTLLGVTRRVFHLLLPFKMNWLCLRGNGCLGTCGRPVLAWWWPVLILA